MDTPSCVNTFEAANGVGDKAAQKRSNTTQVSNVRSRFGEPEHSARASLQKEFVMRTTTDDHDEDVAGTAALARLKEEIETIGDLIADSVAVLEAEDVKTGLRHMKAACKRSLLADLGLPRDIRKFSDLLCRQATTRLSQAPLSVRHSAAEHFTRYIVHDLYTSVANRLMDELDEGRPARISDATVREIADTALKSAPQALVRLAFACGWCIAPFMAVPLLRALMIDERLALGSWAPFAEGVMAMANAEENALIENFVAINDSLSEGPDIEDDHVLSGVDREDPEEVVPEALDDGELASRVEEARSGLTAIEQALAEAAEALADGRPPDMDVVRVLFEARTAFDTAAELLGLVPPPPINMALLEAAFSARLGVASIREALARLAAASGPPIIGAALEVLAVEAARLLETPAWSEIDMLRATHLARLVELGDASARHDDEAVFRLDAELREALEEAARPVVLVASQGRLILPTDLPRQHGSLAGRSDAPDSRSGDEIRAGGALEDGSEPAESALDRVTSTDGSPIAGEPLSDPLDGGGLVRRGELDTEADTLGTDTELLGQKADAETTFRLERPLTVSGHQELEDALEVAASAEVTAAEDGASPDTQSSPASEVPISRRETPASEESVASADGSPTPMPPGVTHPIDAELGRLLGESRFSVAAWLAEAAEQAPGRVNAFRAAALAEALRSSTGEVIAELNTIAGQLSRHDLEGDRIAQLLALVAAIRSVLLVPRSSMLSVVSDLGEIFATEPGIAEIASAASRAATRGLSLTGELLPGVQDVTEIEGRIRKTSLVAKAELSTPRTMRFAAQHASGNKLSMRRESSASCSHTLPATSLASMKTSPTRSLPCGHAMTSKQSLTISIESYRERLQAHRRPCPRPTR